MIKLRRLEYESVVNFLSGPTSILLYLVDVLFLHRMLRSSCNFLVLSVHWDLLVALLFCGETSDQSRFPRF